MFERFTDAGRRVIVKAQEEARQLNHNYIGTEHLLLALLREAKGPAYEALTGLGFNLDGARREIEQRIGRGVEQPGGHIPFTPRAKKVLELSLRVAIRIGHDYIGTEHVLLGLLAEGEGVAALILMSGIEEGALEKVSDAVFEQIGETPVSLEGLEGRMTEIGRRARSALGAVTIGKAADDETRKRLEAIEVRLSVIEQMLRRLTGEEDVS